MNTIAAALLCGLTAAGVPVLQTTAPADVSVELGVEIAARGEQLRLPVILSGKGKPVRSIVVRVTYPNARLQFAEVLRPGAARSTDAKDPETTDVSAEPVTAGTSDQGAIDVRVNSKPGAPLADGIVALLVFKVAKEAEPGDVVVTNTARVIMDGSDEQSAARVKDGVVTILETPPTVVSCFFYMH